MLAGDRSNATQPPFGLLADLGAAVAAELGMTPRQIAQQLRAIDGGLVSDEVARAAAVRGRREMAARRLDPRRFRTPAAPDAPADAGGIEQLLAWGERTRGYPQTAALRARAYLRELAAWHQVAEPPKEPKARSHRRGNAYTERGAKVAYNSLVLAWAASQHLPIAPNGRVSPELVAAYERAHADPAADETPAAALDQARAAKEEADRAAIERAVAAAAGAPPGGPPHPAAEDARDGRRTLRPRCRSRAQGAPGGRAGAPHPTTQTPCARTAPARRAEPKETDVRIKSIRRRARRTRHRAGRHRLA